MRNDLNIGKKYVFPLRNSFSRELEVKGSLAAVYVLWLDTQNCLCCMEDFSKKYIVRLRIFLTKNSNTKSQ